MYILMLYKLALFSWKCVIFRGGGTLASSSSQGRDGCDFEWCRDRCMRGKLISKKNLR